MMASLTFTSNGNTVAAHGPLTRDTAGDAWRQRHGWLGDSGDVVIDLAAVEQVDSAGLALLIQIKAELAQSKRSLSLQNIHTQLKQFAAVSGVTELLSLSYSNSNTASMDK